MNRLSKGILSLIIPFTLTVSAIAASNPDDRLRPGEHVAQIGDIKMHYLIEGQGAPVLMLHGGFGSADHWKAIAPLLKTHFLLIEPDSRGQGRTTGSDAPITYGRMAFDAIGLLNYLGIPSADVIGHSDGGCTTLQLLIDYSERINSAMLIGTPFDTSNYPPKVFEGLKQAMSDLRAGKDVNGMHARAMALMPNPAYWPTLVDKLGATWTSEPNYSIAELGTISSPVLVVRAGHDQYMPPFVFDQLAAAIPKGKVIDLPNATHNAANEFPAELAAAFIAFTNDNSKTK
jgi:pimeloyl-ACP methyl ester carboxylesterase